LGRAEKITKKRVVFEREERVYHFTSLDYINVYYRWNIFFGNP